MPRQQRGPIGPGAQRMPWVSTQQVPTGLPVTVPCSPRSAQHWRGFTAPVQNRGRSHVPTSGPHFSPSTDVHTVVEPGPSPVQVRSSQHSADDVQSAPPDRQSAHSSAMFPSGPVVDPPRYRSRCSTPHPRCRAGSIPCRVVVWRRRCPGTAPCSTERSPCRAGSTPCRWPAAWHRCRGHRPRASGCSNAGQPRRCTAVLGARRRSAASHLE